MSCHLTYCSCAVSHLEDTLTELVGLRLKVTEPYVTQQIHYINYVVDSNWTRLQQQI